jgi:hypothetical protein
MQDSTLSELPEATDGGGVITLYMAYLSQPKARKAA